jgi:hypothetical protein
MAASLDCAATFILCIPACDPLAHDCPSGQVRLQHDLVGSLFACTIDLTGDEGQLYDPCESANGCDPGLLCMRPEPPPSATRRQRAATYPGAGPQRLAWNEEGMAPPGQDDLGLCVLLTCPIGHPPLPPPRGSGPAARRRPALASAQPRRRRAPLATRADRGE